MHDQGRWGLGAVELKVMSFNVRFDNPEDGIHAWKYRKELVVRLILAEGPDLLGTQECTPTQLAFLTHNLQGYTPCIPPRPKDEDSMVQMPTIFYRNDVLIPLDSGEFWLSETPDKYRSKSWGAAFPRLFTYGRFKHLKKGHSFWFANTHLDHVSAEARVNSAAIILKWCLKRRRPIVLVGDFNEPPGGTVHNLLVSSPRGLKDAWVEAGLPGGEAESSTIHHFTGIGKGGRIDWILISKDIEVKETRLVKSSFGFPSDHFPCVATLRLPDN